MDIDGLLKTLENCRSAAEHDELCKLPNNFYADTAAYVKMLDDETNKATGRERDMLSDEAKNVKLVIERIMCQRNCKIINWATIDAGNQKCREIEEWNHWDRVLYTEVFLAVDHYQTETYRKIIKGKTPEVKP